MCVCAWCRYSCEGRQWSTGGLSSRVTEFTVVGHVGPMLVSNLDCAAADNTFFKCYLAAL